MKVGKAIYNILSQSTEVHSNFPYNDANYTPIEPDIVVNGDFAASGSWNGDNTINTTLKQLTKTSGGLSYQSFSFVGTKTYQVVVNVEEKNGSGLTVYLGGTQVALNEGVQTLNIANAGNSFIGFNNGDGSIINSIVVKELSLTKIFPELAPPGVDVPYIVYSVVSNSPSETKNTNGDIDTASIEVYGFQDTYNKAVDLGVSVRAALDRKTGTYNTIEIQSTNYVNEQMDVNEARKLWAAIQDYSIRIKNL